MVRRTPPTPCVTFRAHRCLWGFVSFRHVTERNASRQTWHRSCQWCATPINQRYHGRPRKYCSHSCRQRAYENRTTNRIHDWLEHRERELDHHRYHIAQLNESLEPFVDGRLHPSRAVKAICREVLDVTDPAYRTTPRRRPRPPRHRRPQRRQLPQARSRIEGPRRRLLNDQGALHELVDGTVVGVRPGLGRRCERRCSLTRDMLRVERCLVV